MPISMHAGSERRRPWRSPRTLPVGGSGKLTGAATAADNGLDDGGAGDMLTDELVAPNDLEAFWMPFTANRQFKAQPRLLARAEGMHYTTDRRPPDSRRHRGPVVLQRRPRPAEIVEAIQRQAAELDFAPTFQMGHPMAFELAARLAASAAGRPRPRLLHQLRLGVGRYRAEDRPRLPARPRRGHAHPPDRPRARLPRRRLRRHLGRRHRQQPQVLRLAADRGRPPAAHPRPRAATPSPAASPRTAPSSPMSWSGWWPCTTPRPSPR